MVKPRPKTQSDDFDKIKVVSIINKSKFVVYKAEAPKSKKCYAMKVFPHKNEKPHSCYHKEARFMGLFHKNIVNILDANPERSSRCEGHLNTVSYIVMELAPYGDLADLLMSDAYPRDPAFARTMFHQMINGVEYLHSKGIAHMDLKPENILVAEDFALKITDFDGAVNVAEDTSMDGAGTKNYRAPELIDRSHSIDPMQSDVFSLGVILFLLYAAIFPYTEDAHPEEADLFKFITTGNLDKFWEHHPIVQEEPGRYTTEFKTLFEGMMARDPTKRFTIQQVKASKWFKGATYDEKTFQNMMKKAYSKKQVQIQKCNNK
jgi:serine/threonine protein kinase